MTHEIRSILVATDLSPRSDRAVDRAFLLGRQWEASVCVAHAVERGSPLTALDVRRTLPDPRAQADIRLPEGAAPQAIAETARTINADLIVTGVARFNQLGDFFLGTAVDHVIRNASAPVLVVKQRPQGSYQRLLVATDFSQGAKAALLKAAAMFPEAELNLVHAYHVPFEKRFGADEMRPMALADASAQMDTLLADPDLGGDLRERLRPHLAPGQTASVIAEVAAETWPDLVVIGARGVSGFVQATIGSVASMLLERIQPDTLVIKGR